MPRPDTRIRCPRAIKRLIVLCSITVVYYLFWLAGLAFIFPFPDLARRWRARNFGAWARKAAKVVGLQIKACNPPPVSPFLLVSNHLSYVDIPVLESQVDCTFIAKSEVAGWPILGPICRSLNTIFINRGQKRDILQAMAKAEQTLDEGLGVVLFAEGTSSLGATVTPFKPSLLEFAARRKIPVHFATISYSVPQGEPPAEQSVCWGNDMSFPKHIFRLLQVQRFEATVTFGIRPIQAGDRHVLAAELWSAVHSQFTPVTAAR